MAAKKYFRPSLTASEISLLVAIVKDSAAVQNSPEKQGLLIKLLQFDFKLQTGAIAPAFTSTRQSLEESLGLGEGNAVSQLESRKIAYEKYQKFPELCTPDEISSAKTYAYENDLMTLQEEAEFEMENF